MLLHNHLSPIAITIGPLSVRWYGLGFAGAFLFGEWLVKLFLEIENLPKIDTGRIFLFALVFTVVGARLAHCLVYDPSYYLSHPLKILAIWEGGLASHGGVVGMFAGLGWATRESPAGTMAVLLDRITIPAAIGGTIVRLGNFANSEILGRPTSSVLGIVFDAVDQVPRHPVQLYEAVAYFFLAGLLLGVYRWTTARSRPGLLLGVFLVGVFSVRVLLESFKMPQAAYESEFLVSVGQSLSIPFIALGVLLVVRAAMRSERSRPISSSI